MNGLDHQSGILDGVHGPTGQNQTSVQLERSQILISLYNVVDNNVGYLTF